MNCKDLELAINWLFTAKSGMVTNSGAPIQSHIVSNIASIKRVAAMFNMSNAEALVMTYQGLSNGAFSAKRDVKVKKIVKTRKRKHHTQTAAYKKLHSERMKARWAKKKAAILLPDEEEVKDNQDQTTSSVVVQNTEEI